MLFYTCIYRTFTTQLFFPADLERLERMIFHLNILNNAFSATISNILANEEYFVLDSMDFRIVK